MIPYGIMLIVVGIPIFFMELAIGQYTQEGPLKVWENIFPLLKGLSLIFINHHIRLTPYSALQLFDFSRRVCITISTGRL